MYSDEYCVYRAAGIGEADVVVAWLSEQGIAAEVKDRNASVTMQVPLIVAPAGIEVCVVDSEDADRARELLRDHLDEIKRTPPQRLSGKPVDAACESCGKTSTFPPEQSRTVQICPHCSEYMDVP